MKKFIVVTVFCAAFLFFISHAQAGIGLENREPGKFYFDRVVCGEMVLGTELKILCFEPETDISGEEMNVLAKAFIGIAQKMRHSTSWLTVVKFSGAGKVFVRLSDGYFIYASGSGKNFADAVKNMEDGLNIPTKGGEK